MLLHLGFALVAVVFTAVFARVVFGQLILVELLELVHHCLLQAHGQGAAEALETKHTGGVETAPTARHRPHGTHASRFTH